MSDSTKAASDAARLVSELSDAVAGSHRDLKNMPVFVRPMIRRGFGKRTGLSFEEWDRLLSDLSRRLGSGAASRQDFLAVRRDLEPLLERLADSYRTAPDRAARFMRNQDALERVRETSAARERAARALLEYVRALPD
jgi:hypothetical protein